MAAQSVARMVRASRLSAPLTTFPIRHGLRPKTSRSYSAFCSETNMPAAALWRAKWILADEPKSEAALEFLHRLALFSELWKPDPSTVLDVRASQFQLDVHSLSAPALVAVCQAMATLLNKADAGSGQILLLHWKPPKALLRHLTAELDAKRHDLPSGQLLLAAQALERCGAMPGSLVLEPCDLQTEAAMASTMFSVAAGAAMLLVVSYMR
eukprot:TRINITY_DN112965_c0_g1_i1.p1 TRINITY_DN112965_c0_g1~~TRINITY_DN112965_c0_g1_i1.p1  ORF type:complete len:211 (+),score=38.37 TRINITY_DN112965_c0_g1_i1:40-672(+)